MFSISKISALALAGIWSGICTAQPALKPVSAGSKAASLPESMEERIWTADDESLRSLEKEATRLIQTTPESAYNHFLLSHTYLRIFAVDQQDVESLRAASELATQSLELAPDQEYGYVAMAEVLEVLGQNAKALAVLNEGMERASGWRLQFSKARLSADQSKADDTIAGLTSALEKPGSLRRIIAPYLVIVAQAKSSSANATLRQLERWSAQFPGAGFEESIATLQAERGNFTEAHQIYQGLHKGDAAYQKLMFSDAVICYRRLGKTKLAISELLALKKNLPADSSNQSASNKKFPSMVNAHLGAAYLRMKNFAAAHDAFKSAVEASVDRATMIEFVFNEYKTQKADRQLVTLLDKIIETSPGQGIIHAHLAEALSDKLGRHRAAAESYRRAIVLEPTRSEYYNGLGLTLYRQADMMAALTEFTKATEIDPGDASARYNEACALALLGRQDEALYSLREAIQLEPRLSEQARVDKDFASIKRMTGFQEIIAAEFSEETVGATASSD